MRGLGKRGSSSLATVMLVACADQASPTRDGSTAPARAEIVCRADGSTELSTSSVRARPDGVHFLVRNQLDEPASVNGLGVDVKSRQAVRRLEQRPTIVGVVLGLAPAALDRAQWNM